ncbi:MAG: flavin reductase [Clostridiales bacterium]|nr:flavin reductase [Clostridiales bacterium]
MSFKEINVRDIKENAVKLINNDWALLTAANGNGCNPMTVSWGSIGELWGHDTATVYVRESRFTKTLIDREKYFSLCFFDEKYKKQLTFCGSKSGRDVDKIKETGLTPLYDESAPYFKEAKLVIICRKAAAQKMDKSTFIDKDIMANCYKDNDLHTIYFGYIEKVLISD